jgi:hypothetical protein
MVLGTWLDHPECVSLHAANFRELGHTETGQTRLRGVLANLAVLRISSTLRGPSHQVSIARLPASSCFIAWGSLE